MNRLSPGTVARMQPAMMRVGCAQMLAGRNPGFFVVLRRNSPDSARPPLGARPNGGARAASGLHLLRFPG